jgi:hypothetical protein
MTVLYLCTCQALSGPPLLLFDNITRSRGCGVLCTGLSLVLLILLAVCAAVCELPS